MEPHHCDILARTNMSWEQYAIGILPESRVRNQSAGKEYLLYRRAVVMSLPAMTTRPAGGCGPVDRYKMPWVPRHSCQRPPSWKEEEDDIE